MFSPLERMIAWRYLRARRAEGFISIISAFSLAGIALGVATLITVTSVMNGVREEMLSHFVGLSGHVTVYGNGQPLPDDNALIAQIAAIPGVTRAIPMIEGQVMATNKGRALGAQVSAFRPGDYQFKSEITSHIQAGALAPFLDGEGVVIGERMAKNLGVGVGDSITLISPEGRATIAGLVPRLKAYPVTAIFKLGMAAYDSGLILMPFEEAQIFFKLTQGESSSISAIEVTAAQLDQAPQIAARIQSSLGDSVRVYDWQQSNQSILGALAVKRNVMFVILTLIIIVAAFNIISSLIMLVSDKARDIAILRTIGASRGSIMRIFFLCGSIIGMMGTMMGVALGLLISFNTEAIRIWIEEVTGIPILAEQLYFLSTIPARVDWSEVLGIVALSLLLSFLATLYPARRAASLDPAEVLRYE